MITTALTGKHRDSDKLGSEETGTIRAKMPRKLAAAVSRAVLCAGLGIALLLDEALAIRQDWTTREIACASSNGIDLREATDPGAQKFVEHLSWISDHVVVGVVGEIRHDILGPYHTLATVTVSSSLKGGLEPGSTITIALEGGPSYHSGFGVMVDVITGDTAKFSSGQIAFLFLSNGFIVDPANPTYFALPAGHYRLVDGYKFTLLGESFVQDGFPANSLTASSMNARVSALLATQQNQCCEFQLAHQGTGTAYADFSGDSRNTGLSRGCNSRHHEFSLDTSCIAVSCIASPPPPEGGVGGGPIDDPTDDELWPGNDPVDGGAGVSAELQICPDRAGQQYAWNPSSSDPEDLAYRPTCAGCGDGLGLAMRRVLRSMMKLTTVGRRYLSIWNTHRSEVVAMFNAHPEVGALVGSRINDFMPGLRSYLYNDIGGSNFTLDATRVAQIEEVVNAVKHYGSATLVADLDNFMIAVRLEQGKSMKAGLGHFLGLTL